jgi:hypothetical protein
MHVVNGNTRAAAVGMSHFQAFLTDIRNNAKRIGAAAMTHSTAAHALDDRLARESVNVASGVSEPILCCVA